MVDPVAEDFDSWVTARGPGLLRLAHVLTGNRADAEDVVQDALSRALPRWSRISTVQDPDAYVRRMVLNAHTSRWRKFRRREHPVAEPAPLGEVAGPGGGVLPDERRRIWAACQALPEALESGAEDAPEAAGLVAGARERRRRRARTRAVGGVVAVALAVAAVPVTLSGGDGPSDPAVVGAPAPSADSTPAGWRLEVYRDLQVAVPLTWGHGNLSTWCLHEAEDGSDRPVVERPGGVVAMIDCGVPETGYGLRFVDAGDLDPAYPPGDLKQASVPPGGLAGPKAYPDGAWYGYRTDSSGLLAVQVVAPDRATAQRVLDSVRTVEDADSNGCAVRNGGAAPAVSAGTVTICRYEASGSLVESELLAGADADAAVAAIQAAPVDGRPVASPCAAPALLEVDVQVRLPQRDVWMTLGSACRNENGFTVDGERRSLTEDVVYWALSPDFTGTFGKGVPVPSRLRG